MDNATCFICSQPVYEVFLDKNGKPLNRITDNNNQTFYFCGLCLRKIMLGYLVGASTGTREQKAALAEARRRIRFDDQILKDFDHMFR